MVKRSLLTFVMAFSFVLSPAPFVYAATEGCPGSWTIDTSSSKGIQQLLEAKQRLGRDMVLTEGVLTYANFSGESGPLAAPKDARLSISDVYLYGNTTVTKNYVVQVKNCPGSKTFTMNLGSLKESSGVKSILSNVNSAEWAKANESLFQDFLVATKFTDCLAKKKMRLQKPGYVQHQFYGKTLVILNVEDFIHDPSGHCGLPGRLLLVDKTPSCRYLNSISNGGPMRLGISITMGGKCSFAFASGDGTGTLNLFETFDIDSNNWRTFITCTKGKSKKVVQGLVGYEFKLKCPSGYKKK
jgi:hypothetical protein